MHQNIKNIKSVKKLETVESEVIVPSASKAIRMKKFENTEWPYLLSVPFMWVLIVYVVVKKSIYKLLGQGQPRINTFFFDGLGKSSRKVKENAGSWKALDIVYNHPFPYSKDIGTLLDEFYWNGLNCQGLRNRRKLIKSELRKVIYSIGKKEVRIISLACGSAEVLIELMSELKNKGISIKALLIDKNEEALKRAEELIQFYGLKENTETEKNDVYSVREISQKFQPDIIEMMGFIDYLEQDKAIELSKQIRESIMDQGYYITCNINSNPERYFLTHVINWPMVYRQPKDLAEIAVKAGFTDYEIVYEPLKIHGILIAKK